MSIFTVHSPSVASAIVSIHSSTGGSKSFGWGRADDGGGTGGWGGRGGGGGSRRSGAGGEGDWGRGGEGGGGRGWGSQADEGEDSITISVARSEVGRIIGVYLHMCIYTHSMLSGVLCRSRRAKNTRAGGEKWSQDKGIV